MKKLMLFGEVEVTIPDEPLVQTSPELESGFSCHQVNIIINQEQQLAFMEKHHLSEEDFDRMVADAFVAGMNDLGIMCKKDEWEQ